MSSFKPTKQTVIFSEPSAHVSSIVARRTVAPFSPQDRIVAIIAPQGYGKTTLAADWFINCRESADPVWISLDTSWRDPVHFVHSLLKALGRHSETVEMNPMDAMSRVESGLMDVLQELQHRDRPLVLYFDDIHVLRGTESSIVLSRLLMVATEHLRFVICGRDGTELDLAALTARGVIRWVTQRDLKLGAQNVRELAQLRGVSISNEETDRILSITEGWPALVQLALASGQGFQEVVEGDDALMGRFVYERFLMGLSPSRRYAIFTMATVGEFTSALLETLDVSDAAEAITDGIQLGIVQRRGRIAGSPIYILHSLVEEYALMQFIVSNGASAHALRTRCARWWHAQGESYRAIRTALEGEDASLALTYLGGYARQLVQVEGRHDTFLDMVAQLESRGVDIGGDLMLQAAWAMVFLRRYTEAASWLIRIERDCGKRRSAIARSNLHTTVLQRGVIAGLRDDEANAEVFVRKWLAGAPDPDPFHYGAAQTVLAYAHKCNGRFAEAAQSLRDAQVKFEDVPSPYGLMWVRVISAASLLKAGRHRDALADIGSALTDAPAFVPGAAGLASMLHAIRALLLYERNLCTESMVEVETALPLLSHQGIVDALIAGYVAASRLQAARGDPSGALDIAAEGERVGLIRGFARLQLTMVAERALLLLRAGDVEAARQMAHDYDLLPRDPQTNLHRDKAERLWARLDIAQRRPDLALQWADAGIFRARRSQQLFKLAELLMLRSLALTQIGDGEAAHEALMESLRFAASNGYMRLYLDEGPDLGVLLRLVVSKQQSPTPALSHARALLVAVGTSHKSKSAVSPSLQDHPTERELQILRLSAEGLSNNEVAGRLMLTEGTVKWYLHNLYAKLGVRNRISALREARVRSWL
ncbi:MAG TPA: LuxR C-terminal-related transcriptional regulator [Rugosibacter sp.]